MRRSRNAFFVALAVLFAIPLVARAQGYPGGYPYFGVELGATEPMNDNYRAHVHTGISGSPYVGYMMNDYLGIQLQLHFIAQSPDDDDKGFKAENQITTLIGATAGPRLSIPVNDKVELYGTAQGGGYQGLSGRLTRAGGAVSLGGGLDFEVAPNLAVGVFGRWTRAFMKPRCKGGVCGPGSTGPEDLGTLQVDSQRFSDDPDWVTAGVGLKWSLKPPPPPPPPPPVAKAPPPPPPEPKKIVLRAVYFDFDKSNIRADARPVLDEAVRLLKEEGTVDIVAEGHTDNIGTEQYNERLSERRATAVKQYLVDRGISASRIRIVGYGETRPVATNNTKDGRQQNRRVELHVK